MTTGLGNESSRAGSTVRQVVSGSFERRIAIRRWSMTAGFTWMTMSMTAIDEHTPALMIERPPSFRYSGHNLDPKESMADVVNYHPLT